MADYGMLIDATECVGCYACRIACQMAHNLECTETYIDYKEMERGHFPETTVEFVPRQCMHCTDAPCAAVCPTGATYIDESGVVLVNEERCIGCRLCMDACPYDARVQLKSGLVEKCTFCWEDGTPGDPPACVGTCITHARQFGERAEILDKANERVAVLKSQGFKDANIYGETELDGLHILTITKFDKAAFPELEEYKVSPFVGMSRAMKPITGVISGVTVAGLAVMFALGAGYKRDNLVYNSETEDTVSLETGEVVKHGDGQSPLSVQEHIAGKTVEPEGRQ